MSVSLPIENIRCRADARPLDDEAVSGLMESIEAGVLINAIMVRPIGDQYEVIAGGHRLAACELIGRREISCNIVKLDDLHAELAMIDENLFRVELSPADRAKQTARRKAIYLELHPETKHGENLGNARVANLATPETPAFAKATAAVTGQSERTIRRDAERGEKVSAEVLNLVSGTRLDSGRYLDFLRKLKPEEQVKRVQADLASPRATAPAPVTPSGLARRVVSISNEEQFERFLNSVEVLTAVPIDKVLAGAGRKRAVLGQRVSSLIDYLNEIMEGLDR